MMFASKTPTLRIDESDLKCKNGCDYYGNSQWQGYCSKCHREQMQRQRRAEKATAASTLPKPDRKKQNRAIKLTSNSSFSKFEEKRFKQSETQRKAHLLKFSVFKKNNTDGQSQETSEKKSVEFQIPSIVCETMKRDFQLRFPNLSAQIYKEVRQFATSFIMDVMENAHVLNVDELSERVQRQYQRFMRHMETSPLYAQLDADRRELLIDFVERHVMSYLHELPSVLFSPSGTEDERCDRMLSERIQQLGWVGERHLDCRLDRTSPTCRRLLYRAIAELLGMDGAASPGGKLARVRRCCGHVLALAADAAAPAPASADDLLPALIFTVLKANPPRLISNINFVTRFCNAARLMTGESGYYFTNLCCAVSFIENMTAESLGMDKEEFDCYMAMPASIGGSSWAATLSLCAELREAEELSAQAEQLRERVESATHRAQQLHDNMHEFENEITNKVHEVLSKTPLEIKPRREVSILGKLKDTNAPLLIDLELAQSKLHSHDSKLVDLPTPVSESSKSETRIVPQLLENEDTFDPDDILRKELGFEVIDVGQVQTIQEQGIWETKHTDSVELLTPSPLGFPSFDCHSLDEAMTPDEFDGERLVPGLSAVNYDIDLSDFSADNSAAEDVPVHPPADPFSPDASKTTLRDRTFEDFGPSTFKDPFGNILDSFDQFSLVDTNDKEVLPFEEVHKVSDPFSPIELRQRVYGSSVLLPADLGTMAKSVDGPLVAPQSVTAASASQLNSELTSLLDKNDSPVDSCLLPSPLQPQSTGGVDKVS